jgi:hypothetical protein
MDCERSTRVLLSLTMFYTMLKIESLFVVSVSRNINFHLGTITSFSCLTLYTVRSFKFIVFFFIINCQSIVRFGTLTFEIITDYHI